LFYIYVQNVSCILCFSPEESCSSYFDTFLSALHFRVQIDTLWFLEGLLGFPQITKCTLNMIFNSHVSTQIMKELRY